MRSKITSARPAMMMRGARGVSCWALMIALAGSPLTPRELAVTAVTRALMCELLGVSRGDVAPDELFTVGLPSVADALPDRSLGTIVSELPRAAPRLRRATIARRRTTRRMAGRSGRRDMSAWWFGVSRLRHV